MNHRMPRNRLNSSNYKTSKCLQKEQKLYKWYNRLLHRYVVLNAMVKKMPNVVVVLMFQKGKIENWVMQDTTTMWVAVAAAVMKIWIERTSQRRILWLLQQSQHQYETNFKDYKSRNKQDFDHYKALITFLCMTTKNFQLEKFHQRPKSKVGLYDKIYCNHTCCLLQAIQV